METPRRVVSLLPATTEIVAALGHADRLVGRSHECDHPSTVTELPVVSRPRRELPATSAQTHRQTLALLEDVLSIYEVDVAALREAGPDLIITQDLCEVCAVPVDAVLAAARQHLDADVEVLTSSPTTLAGVLHDVHRIAAALGDRPAGDRLVGRCRSELDALTASLRGRQRPTVALLEWVDPLMAGGNWAPELIEAAAAEPVLGVRGGHSSVLDPARLVEADPDVIVVAPCGFPLDRAVREREILETLDGWSDCSAVRNGRVAFVDGSAYVNRPGPRLVTSAQIIAAIVHGTGPGLELEGVGWQRWWSPAEGRGDDLPPR